MAESKQPGPGRLTAEAAVSELKKEIARRNEEAQKAGHKLRAEREQRRIAPRREWDRYYAWHGIRPAGRLEKAQAQGVLRRSAGGAIRPPANPLRLCPRRGVV